MPGLTYTLTRDDQTFMLDVDYEVASMTPATYDDPAEGGEIEELQVSLDGQPFILTDDEEAALEAHIYATHDYSDDGYTEADWLAERGL